MISIIKIIIHRILHKIPTNNKIPSYRKKFRRTKFLAPDRSFVNRKLFHGFLFTFRQTKFIRGKIFRHKARFSALLSDIRYFQKYFHRDHHHHSKPQGCPWALVNGFIRPGTLLINGSEKISESQKLMISLILSDAFWRFTSLSRCSWITCFRIAW